MADETRSGVSGNKDSLYSTSSNSESTSCNSALRSGSNSSGSSGYGGKPYSGSGGTGAKEAKRTKQKEAKKEPTNTEPEVPVEPPANVQEELPHNELENTTDPSHQESLESEPASDETPEEPREPALSNDQADFSCVVSMQNGIIMYSTSTLHNTLGYPKEMWVGRSFIDFIHPRDQEMFASRISNIQDATKCNPSKEAEHRISLYCRFRQYKSLAGGGFEIKMSSVAYLPFKLDLSFSGEQKDTYKEEKDSGSKAGAEKQEETKFQGSYIVIQATSLVPAYKQSLEIVFNGVIFNIRHSILGVIEHVDTASIPYLGYMPHDLLGRCAIKMYHPEDLCYLRRVYENVVKLGQAPKTSFRMQTQNGDYVRVETLFTCFVNPWSRKLEYVTGQHEVIQGPCDIDVFGPPDSNRSLLSIQKVRMNAEIMREQTLRIMSECLTKRAEIAKQQMSKKYQNISTLMERFMERPDQDFRTVTDGNSKDHNLSEVGSVLLGGISPHHDYYDSSSGRTDTSPSYNQMNYKGILEKFFDSKPITHTQVEEIPDRPKSKPDCISTSPLSQCEPEVSDNESEDEAMVFSFCKDRTKTKLTESALKLHNQEMEAILSKEHRETRYRAEKKTLSRQRLEHLARCNEFSNQSHPPTAFAYPRHSFRQDTISASSSSSPQNKPTKSGQTSKRDMPSTSKRDSTLNKRCIDSKRGVKRDRATASMAEPGRPIKQVKHTGLAQTGPIPMAGYAFGATSAYAIPLVVFPNEFGESIVYAPVQTITDIPTAPVPTTSFDRPTATNLSTNQCSDDSSWNRSTNNEINSGSDQEMQYKTEGDTSSSFYSSFLKLDSSGDDQPKSASDKHFSCKSRSKSYIQCMKWVEGQTNFADTTTTSSANYKNDTRSKNARAEKKLEPPWNLEISPTSDLFYRYRVPEKGEEETLSKDKTFLTNSHQPEDVNEQLDQLYIDLNLQGVTSRLTLEEGITTSGSSGEETVPLNADSKKKRPYSKMAMIYEEDSPFPPAEEFFIDKKLAEKAKQAPEEKATDTSVSPPAETKLIEDSYEAPAAEAQVAEESEEPMDAEEGTGQKCHHKNSKLSLLKKNDRRKERAKKAAQASSVLNEESL